MNNLFIYLVVISITLVYLIWWFPKSHLFEAFYVSLKCAEKPISTLFLFFLLVSLTLGIFLLFPSYVTFILLFGLFFFENKNRMYRKNHYLLFHVLHYFFSMRLFVCSFLSGLNPLWTILIYEIELPSILLAGIPLVKPSGEGVALPHTTKSSVYLRQLEQDTNVLTKPYKMLNLFKGIQMDNLKQIAERASSVNFVLRYLFDNNEKFNEALFLEQSKNFISSKECFYFVGNNLQTFQKIAKLHQEHAIANFNEHVVYTSHNLDKFRIAFLGTDEQKWLNALISINYRTHLENSIIKGKLSAIETGSIFYQDENPKGVHPDIGKSTLFRIEGKILGHSRGSEIQVAVATMFSKLERPESTLGYDLSLDHRKIDIKSANPFGAKFSNASFVLREVDLMDKEDAKEFIENRIILRKNNVVSNSLNIYMANKNFPIPKPELFINFSLAYTVFEKHFPDLEEFTSFVSQICKKHYSLAYEKDKVFILVFKDKENFVIQQVK